LACVPVIKPSDVETTENTQTTSTRGISVAPTYRRSPGVLTRFNPSITFLLALVLSFSLMVFFAGLAVHGHLGDVTFLLQDVRDAFLDTRSGNTTAGNNARLALRIRVNIQKSDQS